MLPEAVDLLRRSASDIPSPLANAEIGACAGSDDTGRPSHSKRRPNFIGEGGDALVS